MEYLKVVEGCRGVHIGCVYICIYVPMVPCALYIIHIYVYNVNMGFRAFVDYPNNEKDKAEKLVEHSMETGFIQQGIGFTVYQN